MLKQPMNKKYQEDAYEWMEQLAERQQKKETPQEKPNPQKKPARPLRRCLLIGLGIMLLLLLAAFLVMQML